jgi:hypothetical protein
MCKTGGYALMVINTRRVLLIMPIYVAYMVCINVFFDSAGLDVRNNLPLWLIIAFTAMSISTVLLLIWFISSKVRGKISVRRERFYLGILIIVFIADFIDDALKGLTSLIFDTSSIWVMIPMYLISYVALWVVIVIVFNKIAKRPEVAVSANIGPE